jgi:TRAP-type transport system small permease protein
VQVFTRYVLGRPLAWVEESATYAFIWMAFVGASLGLKQGRHILISTFGSRLPARAAAALRLLVWALVLGTLVVLVVQGIKVMGVESRSKTISLPIELPRSWFYSLPLTLSCASMALTSLYVLLLELPVVAGRRPAPAARMGIAP